MIIGNLHRQMVAVDRQLHRQLRIHQPKMDWSVAAELNALFVAGAEFGDVCREYPILFVRAGTDPQGKPQVAPIAAFGLAPKENLFLRGSEWRAHYVPALLRAYPFALGRVGPDQRGVLSIDIGWKGLSQTEGVPLFDEAGEPTEHLKTMTQQLQQIELEVQRTRELGRLLLDKDLLREMRFDADLPGGEKLKVDGFFTVDEKQLAKLSDADLLALHKSGVMGLVYAHLVSMGNLRKMVQWRIDALPAAAQAGVAPS
ncbi:MAG: SapC family protein [Burkholderiales bacterium]|nr:SapC family protein [Burkholderiales bacterium]